MPEAGAGSGADAPVVLAGGSGLVGSALRRALAADGIPVLQLVRRPARNPDEAEWSPSDGRIDASLLEGARAVVNLSGSSISNLPWTPHRRRELVASRLDGTRTLVEAVRRCTTPPRALLSGSAVGYYGDRPGEELDESAHPGSGFLADLCVDWEAEAARARDVTRVVHLRTGLVLAAGAGTLLPVDRLARLGAAGPLGGGRQHWPWIALADIAAALRRLVDAPIDGPVNLVGPRPATAADVMRAVASAVHRPYWLPAPRLALQLALGDAADELLLADQRAVPARLTEDGFVFRDRTAPAAIRRLYASGPPAVPAPSESAADPERLS